MVNKNTGKTFEQELSESDNRKWQPHETVSEQCVIKLDKTLIAGKYDLLISMRDECGFHNTSIQLAIKKERETVPGWYKLGEVLVSQ